MRRIIVFTGTRADWGILSSVARSLNKRADVDLTVAATNMHLSERFGHTVDEIRADGFEPLTFAMDADAVTPRQRVEAMAECMAGAAGILDRIKPGLAVILGDRFEMLACATACAMTGVPIAHIAGGEISEGAIDDSLRHAITKLSALHLTATEPYRHRVIAMGEDPARVFNTGALGVGNLRSLPDEAPLEELEELTGFPVGHRTILVTYHAATLDTGDIDSRISALLGAIDDIPDISAVVTYPNNDDRGRRIIARLEEWAPERRRRVALIPSLGRRRYHSMLRHVGAVVGNSSSGLVEVPSAGIPTVDIGIRQRGRIAGESVIHCGDSRAEIAAAIRKALSPEMQRLAAQAENPYYKPDTLARMTDLLATYPLEGLLIKRFHDINPL